MFHSALILACHSNKSVDPITQNLLSCWCHAHCTT